jgi:nicotinamidase-related amidase
MLISRDNSCLLVVDIQEKLLPAMQDPMLVVRNTGVLMQAAARLGVPILVSEQYPQGLGPTVAELRHLAPAESIHAKTTFSCADDQVLRQKLAQLKRAQVILCGIEAHVCVLQTALGLSGTEPPSGLSPVVVADATSSRTTANREAALARLRADSVQIATTEMVLFEWLGRAGTPEFKELSRLIR